MRPIARFIRSILPVPVRRAIQRTGRFFGTGLDTAPDFPCLAGSLQTLRAMGIQPGFCVDVGAYHGEWTQQFRTCFPESKILMVEAQEPKRSILQQTIASAPHDITLEIALLGPTDGETVDFTEMETGSSVFAEASPYARQTVQRTTCRLDTILSRGSHPKVDFLKLDVQGYELHVLRGAPEALRQTTAVLMETSLVPTNTGCPLFAEVIAFMDVAGFRLFDFCSQVRRKDGVLWQTDLLFLRHNSPILPDATLTRDNWR